MRRIKLILTAALTLGLSYASAQVKQVTLEQTPGEFSTQSLDLEAGKYQFNIANNKVDHEVGFVLVPKGMYSAEDHIKEAYVKETVATGKTSATSVVNLKPGEYEYFCPMNPTPKYTLRVHNKVETIKLVQTSGDFNKKSVTVASGPYQFDIANKGVGHDVGFVLVPKGKYEAEHHIKAAYVTAPVSDGKSEKSGVVNLEAGEYEYFCPMNPTPKYTLTVTK